MSKITKSTFKSFLRKNEGKVYIRVKSTFDGMTDCVQDVEDDGFTRARKADFYSDSNFGIQGVWLVMGSRDYFTEYDDGKFRGIEVYNCCGHFVVAVKK